MNAARRQLAKLALLSPSVLLMRVGLFSSPSSAAQRTQGNASEEDAREVWWRAEWARIIELSGSWAVQAEPDFTFFLPEDPACVLRILRRSTGEVFEYHMSPGGQVALALGWILVSRDAALDCAGRGALLMKERPDLGDRAYSNGRGIQSALIERVVVRGSQQFRFEPGEHEQYHLRAWREVDPNGPANQLVVQGIVGNVWTWPAKDKAAQTRVLFYRHQLGYPRDRLQIEEVVERD